MPDRTTPHNLLRRRDILQATGALVAFAHSPGFAAMRGRDPRLMVIFLRGGLDGLAAVPPVGDPAFAAARSAPADPAAAAPIALDDMFRLHGAMPRLGQLFRGGQALIFHAIASPYRDRSHFSAQDVMETGVWPPSIGHPGGWLNRAMQALPPGEPVATRPALAIAPTIPLMMQGRAPVETFQQQRLAYADDDTIARLMNLYEARDKALANALKEGVDLDRLTRGVAPGQSMKVKGRPDFASDAATAAKLLARADGPRIGMMNLLGWDTHTVEDNRLDRQLASLDDAIGALRDGLGTAWNDTVVMIITEFGRTVRYNGNGGCDHGNGTVAFLLGGAVKGGRVSADWPGLAQDHLLDGRDLMPTTDIRALFKGVLADHLGVGEAMLARDIFPDTTAIRPMKDLIV